MTTVLMFVGGGILLVGGAELLVRGASRLAVATGISPLVVGLTVVAFGTSAPEFAVSVGSALSGAADVALGNVVGSNIFNVLFILGLAAIIAPLGVDRQLVRIDVPLMIAVTAVVVGMSLDGSIGRVDGLLLFGSLIAYTVWLIRASRKATAEAAAAAVPGADTTPPASEGDGGSKLRDVAFVLVGLGLLVLGSRWFVEAAVETAQRFGVSELVVSLTIVAAGTSLPEVATSVLASIRGERDIAVGNVIGSNIFNLLGVLGLSATIAPEGIAVATGALTFDMPVMLAVAVVSLPILFSGWIVGRWEGALFLFFYVAYTTWLILDATTHAVQDEFAFAMTFYVLPIIGIGLSLSWFRGWMARRTAG